MRMLLTDAHRKSLMAIRRLAQLPEEEIQHFVAFLDNLIDQQEGRAKNDCPAAGKI